MIGIFDSGIGGITVLRALHSRMPNLPMVYFADFEYCPYGGRSEKDIFHRSASIIRWMKNQGVSLVVVACHTSSSVLNDHTLDTMGIPIVTMLDPTVRSVMHRAQTESWKQGVGLIATELSIQKGSLVKRMQSSGFSLPIHAIACPYLAPLIESCQWTAAIDHLAQHAFPFFQSHPVDALIYGCTHYPFIDSWIRPEHGCPLRLDPAHAVTDDVLKRVHSHTLVTTPSTEPLSFFYTGMMDHGAERLKNHWGENLRSQHVFLNT